MLRRGFSLLNLYKMGVNSLDKTQAARIIMEAALIYDKNFNKRNLLIIFGAPNAPKFIETYANDKNFHHLTGVKLNTNKILENVEDKTSSIFTIFFYKALNKRLSPEAFEFKNETTEQKLRVLIQTLRVSSNSKMFGTYSGTRMNLKTDKLAGGVKSFIGFLKVGKNYVPNTVMEDDIRKNSKKTERVLAILSKKVDDLSYNKIESVAKKIDVIDLLRKISDKVPIDPTLLQDEHSIEKDTAAVLAKCHQMEEWSGDLDQKIEQEHGIKKEVPETNHGSR